MHRTPGGTPRRWLLVSDLDDTLLAKHDGDAVDNAAFGSFVSAVATRPELLLVVNSSRPRASVLATLSQRPIVRRAVRRVNFTPDGLITAMGTEILLFGAALDSAGDAVDRWPERFEGWDRRLVDEVMARFEGRGVVPHADEFQAPFKASFAVPPDIRNEVVEAIRALDQPSRVVVSGDSDVDVLPPNAGKGEATRFVAEILGVDRESGLIVAGDSANDLEMFAESNKGIVVGNARAELSEAVKSESAYRSAAPRAAGVLEGLRHWGAVPPIEAPVHHPKKGQSQTT